MLNKLKEQFNIPLVAVEQTGVFRAKKSSAVQVLHIIAITTAKSSTKVNQLLWCSKITNVN